MLNPLLERFPHLKDKLQGFEQAYHRTEVPAKTVLLHEGDVSKKAYFIEQGCLRAWFNNKGKDVTFQFFFENEAVSSIESFRKNIPSLVTIEAIEPSVLYWIHKKDWEAVQQIVNEDAKSRSQYIDMMFERQVNYMHHFMSFIKRTPKERYLDLLQDKPHIVKRIPQHYIASYLGVTSVSLSRIRNAVAREPK